MGDILYKEQSEDQRIHIEGHQLISIWPRGVKLSPIPNFLPENKFVNLHIDWVESPCCLLYFLPDINKGVQLSTDRESSNFLWVKDEHIRQS